MVLVVLVQDLMLHNVYLVNQDHTSLNLMELVFNLVQQNIMLTQIPMNANNVIHLALLVKEQQ